MKDGLVDVQASSEGTSGFGECCVGGSEDRYAVSQVKSVEDTGLLSSGAEGSEVVSRKDIIKISGKVDHGVNFVEGDIGTGNLGRIVRDYIRAVEEKVSKFNAAVE